MDCERVQFSQIFSKIQYPFRCFSLFIMLSSVFIGYLLVSLLIAAPNYFQPNLQPQEDGAATTLDHVVFGIASSVSSWSKSKEYVKLWWNSQNMRGCVFLESMPPDSNLDNNTNSLPPICISGDTSRFRYTHSSQMRSAIRFARIVLETVELNHQDNVRWYVFGDDDTVFFPENLVKTLSKYNHKLWYYIGANSENLEQNQVFGFRMVFGGAGFAISSPLARVLAKVFDSCIERYPHLFGADSRIYHCISELGIGTTHEPGFHQLDVRGDAFGFLAAHPIAPLVSMHNLDHIDPIFPKMTTVEAMKHLLKAVNADPQRILQQTICYDRWFTWTLSVSWGYAVRVLGFMSVVDATTHIHKTFRPWTNGNILKETYVFNTKEPHPDPCGRPTVFFFDSISPGRDGIKTVYKKPYYNCSYDRASPKVLEEIRVYSKKLDLSIEQLQAPRRQCCDMLPSSNNKVMDIAIRECKEDELIYMHI